MPYPQKWNDIRENVLVYKPKSPFSLKTTAIWQATVLNIPTT